MTEMEALNCNKEVTLNVQVTGKYRVLIVLLMQLYESGFLGDDLDKTIRYLKTLDRRFKVEEK